MYILHCSIQKYTTVYQNPEHELCREVRKWELVEISYRYTRKSIAHSTR